MLWVSEIHICSKTNQREKSSRCGRGGSEVEAAAQEDPGSGVFGRCRSTSDVLSPLLPALPLSCPPLTSGMWWVAFSFSGKNQKMEWRDKIPVKGWKERSFPSMSLKASRGRGSLVAGAGAGCCCEQVFCFVGHKVDASRRENLLSELPP